MIGGENGSPAGTKKRVCETLLKNVKVPTKMKFEVGVVIITFQMACQLERFPFSQNFRFVIPENFQFKWKGLFPPRNRASFWVLHLTFHWLIADEVQQNKMDDNVAVPLICDFLVNCDEEIERFLRNENDFDFVAIAGVSCCFVRRNLTRIQNYFESTAQNWRARNINRAPCWQAAKLKSKFSLILY